MKLIDVHAQLLKMERPVFQTSDAAAWLKINNAHTSKLLARLVESGHLVHLGRGSWAFRDRVEPLALPEYLTNPFPSYVSLQSALYYHGMISQIPEITYAVSIARTKRYETSLGMVSIHHVRPSFFFGFENVGRSIAKMATPEKALIDFFYLSPAKSKLFRALPEVELPRSFRPKTAHNIISHIMSERRRVLVKNLFEDFISKPGR
jgi:predicted transcriptional regulator of viral defense system